MPIYPPKLAPYSSLLLVAPSRSLGALIVLLLFPAGVRAARWMSADRAARATADPQRMLEVLAEQDGTPELHHRIGLLFRDLPEGRNLARARQHLERSIELYRELHAGGIDHEMIQWGFAAALINLSVRRQIEGDLTAAIGMRVTIDHRADGQGGQISIRYKSLDDLDEICRKLTE